MLKNDFVLNQNLFCQFLANLAPPPFITPHQLTLVIIIFLAPYCRSENKIYSNQLCVHNKVDFSTGYKSLLLALVKPKFVILKIFCTKSDSNIHFHFAL